MPKGNSMGLFSCLPSNFHTKSLLEEARSSPGPTLSTQGPRLPRLTLFDIGCVACDAPECVFSPRSSAWVSGG